MRFEALGTGTCVPDAQRGPAGFLVRTDEGAWLVDGGSGTLRACSAAGVDPRTLTGGVFSHRHVDHTGDLVPLLFAMRVGPPPRAAPYPIWAGAGMAAFLDGLRAVYGKWMEPRAGIRLTELSLEGPDTADLGGVVLSTRPANHSAGALHLRFEHGGSRVVFSGDTGPSDELITLARGVDLLVCECASPTDAPIPGHLTPDQVAGIVDAARPGQVWLTHFYPDCDPAGAVASVARTGVPVLWATDGQVFQAG